MERFDVTSKGIRINPNLDPRNDIFHQIAAHKAKQAKGNSKQQINAVLDSN